MRCCLFKNLSDRFRTESPPRRGRLVSQFFGHRGESPMGRVGERVGDGESGRWEKIFLLPSFLFPLPSDFFTLEFVKTQKQANPVAGGRWSCRQTSAVPLGLRTVLAACPAIARLTPTAKRTSERGLGSARCPQNKPE